MSKNKFAILIGNFEYKKGRLKNPGNDVILLKKVLEDLNFEVVDYTNLEIRAFQDVIDKELKIIQKEVDVIQNNLTLKMQEFGKIEGEIDHAKRQVAIWEAAVAEAEDWKTQHKKLEDYHTWIKEFFIPTINEIEKQVLISIQQDFNETYRRWFKILIDDSSKESRLDENFTPILEQDGFEQDFYNLSGGEKTSVSLAYRLSLNTMMRKNTESLKSNLLILDEPTDGFSQEQLDKIKDVLDDLNIRQILLVSHESKIESFAEHIIRIAKSEHVSCVV